MASENVLTFSTDNFEAEVLGSDVPVLVDFWAEWCAPCRALGPTIDGLADDYAGRVKVGKLNLDEHQAIAQQYQISQIPTLLVFKGGELAERLIGLKPKHEFQQVLDGLLQ